MWKIPIISRIGESRQTGDPLRDLRSLPVYYMGEWSQLGLVVESLREAIEILDQNGYQVEGGDTDPRAEVSLSGPEGLGEIVALLKKYGIASEVGDVIDTIYRG
ncbi:MAG: hypothetical protein WAW37_09990 [Syntrophobacteraceae bacterium]